MHEKYIKAGHPATDIEDLRLLAKDDIDNVRRRVAENLKTPAEILAVLAADGHPEVRIAVAENIGCEYSRVALNLTEYSQIGKTPKESA